MSNFSSEIIYLYPDQITINRSKRQRTEIDTTDLINSIRENGVINPIIIKSIPIPPPECREAAMRGANAYILIAGERRLESCRELNIPVPCRLITDDDNEIGEKVIELEENLKRKNLFWRDECLTIAELHNTYLAQDPTHTLNQTAKSLSLSIPHISNCLTIAKYRDLKLLDSVQSISQAMGLLTRFHLNQTTAISSIIANNPLPDYLIPDPSEKKEKEPLIINTDLDYIPPTETIISINSNPITITTYEAPPLEYIKNQEFTNYILELAGVEVIFPKCHPKFNFIYLDIDFNHIDEYINLCRTQLMSIESYIMIWYKDLDEQEYLLNLTFYQDLILASPQPLIWFKPDIKEYESALIFGLNIQKKLNLRPYIYPAPTSIISTDKKPESMLRFFFQKILTKDTNFFDPCCGNGASLRAADSIGVNSIFGLEPDKNLATKGNELIQRDRLLRKRF